MRIERMYLVNQIELPGSDAGATKQVVSERNGLRYVIAFSGPDDIVLYLDAESLQRVGNRRRAADVVHVPLSNVASYVLAPEAEGERTELGPVAGPVAGPALVKRGPGRPRKTPVIE